MAYDQFPTAGSNTVEGGAIVIQTVAPAHFPLQVVPSRLVDEFWPPRSNALPVGANGIHHGYGDAAWGRR
jgi:hypothetical protein